MNVLEQQLAELQAQAAAESAEVRVPANAFILTPCLTREMVLSRLPPGTTAQQKADLIGSMSWDDLGCRIDFNTGYRIPEDCRTPAQGERRSLCPGVPREYQTDTAQRLAAFAAHAVPVMSNLLPILGPGLSEALAPVIAQAMESLGLTGSSWLSDQIKRLGTEVSAFVLKTFKVDTVAIVDAAKNTFKTLAVTAKTIADAINVRDMTSATAILGYANAREGLSVARNMLVGHPSTLKVVRGLAVDSARAIVDYSTAMLRQDAIKALTSVGAAVDVVLDERGDVSAGVIDGLLKTMPSVKGLSTMANFHLDDVSAQLSDTLLERFAGRPEDMIRAFDPMKFARLIPDPAARLDFINAALDARALDLQIAPFLKRATNVLEQRFDVAKIALKENLPALSDVAGWRAKEAAVRAQIKAATDEADRTMKQGLALYDPRELGR